MTEDPQGPGAGANAGPTTTLPLLTTAHLAAINTATVIWGLFPRGWERRGKNMGLLPSPLKFSCDLYSNRSLMSLSQFPATLSHH